MAVKADPTPLANAALKDATQKLLDQIAERHVTQSQAEALVQRTIQSLPSLKQRLADILSNQGEDALANLFKHPKVYIPLRELKQWVLA
ncbi:MAG: hypothetical protein AAFY78_10010 [Cyanobacteria bacterium J06648_16]